MLADNIMQNGFTLKEYEGVKYLTCDIFTDTGIVSHCFPTRLGGVSAGNGVESLNLSFKKEKSIENVKENYKRLCIPAGINYDRLVMPSQIHSDYVLEADYKNVITRDKLFSYEGDASITNKPNLTLCTFHADCIPVLMLDKKEKYIATVHSGWRGTLKKICVKTIEMLKSRCCKSENIIAAVGPCICKNHFEVDEDVATKFSYAFGEDFVSYNSDKNKYNIDLQEIVRYQLLSCGLMRENVSVSNLCTFCNEDLFFSHRRQKGMCGTHASMIQLL